MIDGLSAINPVNGKDPDLDFDYVLMSYGTGAIGSTGTR